MGGSTLPWIMIDAASVTVAAVLDDLLGLLPIDQQFLILPKI